MCKKGSVNHQSLLKQMLFFLLIYYALLLVIKYPSKMPFKGTMTPSLLANSPEYWGKSYSSVVYLNLLFSCQIICTLGGSRKQLCLLQTKGVTLILSWVTALNSGIWGMHPVAQAASFISALVRNPMCRVDSASLQPSRLYWQYFLPGTFSRCGLL